MGDHEHVCLRNGTNQCTDVTKEKTSFHWAIFRDDRSSGVTQVNFINLFFLGILAVTKTGGWIWSLRPDRTFSPYF